MKKFIGLIALISTLSLTGCGEEPVVPTALPNSAVPQNIQPTQATPEPTMVQDHIKELPKMLSEAEVSTETVGIVVGEKEAQEEQELQYFPVNSEDLFWDDYGSLHVKSYCVTEYFKDQVIVVTADFTNSHSELDLSSASLGLAAYQNGARLNQCSHTSYEKDVYTQIKPGATLEIAIVYYLRDTVTPVELELGPDIIQVGNSSEPTGLCTIPLQ